MRNQIEALMQASDVTGLAVALIDNGATTLTCFGQLDEETVSQETVWTVASLTKPIFVYGVLQLVQRGLLELDRPLQAYLPKPYLEDTAYLPHMTTRHAMSHTTGFPNWRDAQGLRASFQPGTRFSYSSEGLNYLQIVVEHIIGMPFSDYLKVNLFLPFGMTHTELRRENESTIAPTMAFLLDTCPANGALSLRTTIADYARFVSMMFETSPADGQRLDEQWLKAMLTPQTVVGRFPTLHWGLGWGLQHHDADTLSFWHWGARGIPKTMNFAIGLPEQRKAMVIFTNHADGLYLCRDIIQSQFSLGSFPAFDWLLPAKHWRADGSNPIQ